MPPFIRALVDLVLPVECLGCRRPGLSLCPACCAPGPVLQVRAGPVLTFAAAPYRGPLRSALVHYKERGRRDLADPLARLLGRALTAAWEEACAVEDPSRRPSGLALVPVPSRQAAARRRGGDHVLRLARHSLDRSGPGGPAASVLVTDALVFTRRVRDANGLDRAARQRNLAGAMRARPPSARYAGVILVDDIVTTGATLTEAARALTSAGWPVAAAAVVAATRPSGGRRDGRREKPRRLDGTVSDNELHSSDH